MSRSSRLLDPARIKNIQDTIYAVIFCGVTVAFMLFLLGSTSIMTSLSIIGMLLCLSLVGSVLRFLSMGRADRDLKAQQTEMDRDIRTLHTRVNDHDLLLLELTGKIDTLSTEVEQIKEEQDKQASRQRMFMNGLKDRIMQLVSMLTRQKENAAAAPVKKAKATKPATPSSKFRMVPAMTANDVAATPAPDSQYDDDVVVSPSLIREALRTAINTQRIDIYMQPIATLPQRRVHAYEIYGRIRLGPGVYIPAREYRGIAAHEGYLVAIDRMVLQEIGRQKTPPVPLFVNISHIALADRETMMQVVRMVRMNPDLAEKLVLEVTQKDMKYIGDAEESVMRELQRLGIRFALNDVQSPDLDLNRMATLGFRYLKLPQDRLLTGPDTGNAATLIQRFVTRLQARNIELIVGRVESDRTVRQLLDYPVHLAQGYLFGRPDRPVAYNTTSSKVA